MITLYGHGYIGTAIAKGLINQRINFSWKHAGEKPFGDLIINAAGYTGKPNVDACETERIQCVNGNIQWPLECEKLSGDRPIIHIASGCIYNGGPFNETDKPNFNGSFYSACKAFSERSLDLTHSWMLRVRMPFGAEGHPKNLLTKLSRYQTLIDSDNSLTCIEDLAKVVAWFVKNRPGFGIYNTINPGHVTTREIVSKIGLKKQWFADENAFMATVKAPRSNCILDATKLSSIYPMRFLNYALDDCIGAFHARQTLPAA